MYHVGKDKLGVFPRYKVDDVDDRRWNEKELDWEVIGKRPLTLPEWYNPAARFDNEEAIVKYGVTFRQHVTCDQVLEVIHSVGDAPPEIGDWVLVDEEEHGLSDQHILSIKTIARMRDCLSLISDRERELNEARGIEMTSRPKMGRDRSNSVRVQLKEIK